MNEEIRWLVNDRKVEDMRERMIEAREEYRKKNPICSKENEERHLNKLFEKEMQLLLKEQMGIIKSSFLPF